MYLFIIYVFIIYFFIYISIIFFCVWGGVGLGKMQFSIKLHSLFLGLHN